MNSVPRVARTSAVAALVLATVWLFWPSTLGGATTYLTTHGISMEPRFHSGDLAVLGAADGYSVGDVVAYHSDTLNTVVMHRIVSGAGNAAGFTTKGDNNSWLDPDHPTDAQILGRLSFRIPHGGAVLGALRSPGVLLPLAGILAVVLGAMHDPRGLRTRRWLRRHRGARAPARGHTVSTRGRARQIALGAGAVALASAIGCGVLLEVPATETKTRTVTVTATSQFSYAGAAVPGTTYPNGAIATGDTVWNRLAKNLTVSAATTVTGSGLAGIAGSVRLDVRIAAADGWSTVVNSGPPTPLDAGKATAAVAVNTNAAASLLSRHYAETGAPNGSATLTVVPVSTVTGTVAGTTFTAASPAGLAFTLDSMALRPASTEASALTPSAQTPVSVHEVAPRTLPVLAASVPIAAARKLAGAVLLLSLLTLTAGAWIGRIGRGDVSDRFLVRHADRILPVASFDPGGTVIDVADAESLHRVAERFDSLVLHHAGADEDVFAVRDIDATYRFVVPGGSAGRRGGLPPVPARPDPQPADVTTPLPRAVPGTTRGSLWGQVA